MMLSYKRLLLSNTLLISLCFVACEQEPPTSFQIEKPAQDSFRIDYIDYSSTVGNVFQDIIRYRMEYEYTEDGKLSEVKNYYNFYDKKYRYDGDKVSSITLFDKQSKAVAMDSFLYNDDGFLVNAFTYQIDDLVPISLREESYFFYDQSKGTLRRKEVHLSTSDNIFVSEYTWDKGNVVSRKQYLDGGGGIDVLETFQYDQFDNYQCLSPVVIDEPISTNNITEMQLTDFAGNYDGTIMLRNEVLYNENDLPEKIISVKLNVFDVLIDTIYIKYQ